MSVGYCCETAGDAGREPYVDLTSLDSAFFKAVETRFGSLLRGCDALEKTMGLIVPMYSQSTTKDVLIYSWVALQKDALPQHPNRKLHHGYSQIRHSVVTIPSLSHVVVQKNKFSFQNYALPPLHAPPPTVEDMV